MGTRKVAGIRMSDWRKLTVEKGMIESRFTCIKCNEITIRTKKLVCRGLIRPTEHSNNYQVRIEYSVWGKPAVFIERPEIVPSAKIHIYREGHLCLYYPKETPWNNQLHISDTIIPWTSEWLIFYELYKIRGVWLGKSVCHLDDDKSDTNG